MHILNPGTRCGQSDVAASSDIALLVMCPFFSTNSKSSVPGNA